ncbi:hypothetical protein DCAR_0832754 [Daucus carota subsp. sativus]|uniref:Uncharacterized protein n=1 Tax=Daucus carota subsp. sativus TaxID=79200 RepID=A0AAF0XSE5_DAUCS|nr:hypothetical protein DCAR_0832754 [Daucus carota subsp. sativus]
MALMGGFARIGNNEINDAEKGSDIHSQEAQKAEGKRQKIEAILHLFVSII